MTDPDAELIARLRRVHERWGMPCAQEAADRLEALLGAGAKICEGFDKGLFIRSTKGDDDPARAIKILPYLRALAKLAPPEEPTDAD